MSRVKQAEARAALARRRFHKTAERFKKGTATSKELTEAGESWHRIQKELTEAIENER